MGFSAGLSGIAITRSVRFFGPQSPGGRVGNETLHTIWERTRFQVQGVLGFRVTIGALIVRIGFRGPFCYNYKKPPPT